MKPICFYPAYRWLRLATAFIVLLLMHLAVVSLVNAEIESNNTPSLADPLTSGVGMSGRISPAGDVDWFKITVSGSGSLAVSVIDTTNDTVVGVIQVGKGPKGVAAGIIPTAP